MFHNNLIIIIGHVNDSDALFTQFLCAPIIGKQALSVTSYIVWSIPIK